MGEVTISELAYSPIRSGHMLTAEQVTLGPTGIRGDRQFMVVAPDREVRLYKCVSQEVHPPMARLTSEIDLGRNVLSMSMLAEESPGPYDLAFDPDQMDGRPVASATWGHPVTGLDQGDEVAGWLAEALEVPGARLLQASPAYPRTMSLQYRRGEDTGHVAFAGRSPLSLGSMSSLRAVREQLRGSGVEIDEASLMARFRTNIWVGVGDDDDDDFPPFREDFWRELLIGDDEGSLRFMVVRAIARCKIIETDHQAGVYRRDGVLKALAALGRNGIDPHNNERGLFFAEQAVYSETKGDGFELRRGDTVRVTHMSDRPNIEGLAA